MLYLYTMTREEIHNEIDNTLKLIEINNNRMYLNDSDFELDLALMRSQIIRLYQLHDQLQLASTEEIEETPIVKPPESKPAKTVKESPAPVINDEVVEEVPEVEEAPVAEKPTPKVVEKPVEEEKPVAKPKVVFTPQPVEPEIEEEPAPVVETPAPEVVEPEVEEVLPEPTPEPVVETPAPKKEAPKPVKSTPKVAEAGGNDVYARLKNTKLESIKKGISISKRYEVQNELFGNDPQVYNEAIQTLDTQNNLEEAMDYFDNTLMVYHQWEEDNALVEEIRELLLRRYM